MQALINTSNLDLLKRMMDLIENVEQDDPAITFTTDLPPITLAQMKRDIATSQAQIERGEFTTLEELEEESKSWV